MCVCVGGWCQELRSHWSIKGKSLKGHTEFDTSLPATHSNLDGIATRAKAKSLLLLAIESHSG